MFQKTLFTKVFPSNMFFSKRFLKIIFGNVLPEASVSGEKTANNGNPFVKIGTKFGLFYRERP